MTMPVTGAVVVDDEASTVCWGAVIAGGVAAAAVTLVLLAFGVGVGFSVVSPWADQGVSATTFHVGAGIYLIVVAMLASTVGGYLAGRLRARWSSVHEDEIYFRDTAHGFLAWALATVLTATVHGRGDHPHPGRRDGRRGAGRGGHRGQRNSSPTDIYVDRLLRNDAPRRLRPARPAQPRRSSASGNAASTYAELRPDHRARDAQGRRGLRRRSRLRRPRS